MAMSFGRSIPINLHGALELAAAPLLFVAPFALGFDRVAGALSIALSVLIIGLALSLHRDEGGERGGLPLSAHAGFDRVLALTAIVTGALIGLGTGDTVAAVFIAGFGAAHLALTASTRYSRPPRHLTHRYLA